MAENFEPNANFTAVSRTPWQDFWHHFRRNRPAVLGIIVILMLGLVAISALVGTSAAITGITGGQVQPVDPNRSSVRAQFVPPMGYGTVEYEVVVDGVKTGEKYQERKLFVLGSDDLGRDLLHRLWSGSTVSLLVGLVSVGISVVIGILVGGIAGFYGRGRVTLPFILAITGPPIGVLVSTFEGLGGFRLVLAALFHGAGAAGFLLILAGALTARAWRVILLFIAVAGVAAFFFVWPASAEASGKQGEALTAHRTALQGIHDVRDSIRRALPDTREYERQKSMLAAGTPGVTAESVAALAAVVGLSHAAIDAEIAGLAVLRARAAVLTAEATIDTADVTLAANASPIEGDDAAEAERAGKVSKANREKKDSTEALPKLKEELADAEKKLKEAAAITTLPEAKFKVFRDLQLTKAEQNKLKAPHDAAEKTAIEQLMETNGAYATTRVLVWKILVGFALVLSFLLLTKAGQDGARRTPALNWAFVPVITVDNFAMRSVEVLMTMPTLVLLLTIMAFYERDVYLVMFVIGIMSWMGTARFVRAEILSLRERDFISAARSLGLSDTAIIIRHLVPNALSPVLVSATIGVASAIILESTLSFLGLGAAPDQVTWGKMLADSRAFITHAPWLFITPGIAILFVVLAFNLLGEGMREAMNPKLRKR